MITLYVVRSLVYNRRYSGITNNTERRLAEHRRRNSKAGQQLGEFILLHSEELGDYAGARRRERYLKGGHGRAWLDRLEKRVGPAGGGVTIVGGTKERIMRKTALLLAMALAVGTALASVPPIHAAAAEEAPAYTVFHSPPERLDALLWAIVDCYPFHDLEEAEREFLRRLWPMIEETAWIGEAERSV